MVQLEALNGEFVDGVKPIAEMISKIPGVRRVSACSYQRKVADEQLIAEILPLSTGFFLVIAGKEYSQKILVSVERESDWHAVKTELKILSVTTPAIS